MNFGTLGMISMATCLIYNTHKLIMAPIRGKRTYSKARSSEIKSFSKTLKESPRIFFNIFIILMCIIGAATTDFGPMALYCWTRCAENGIYPDYTNGGTNSKIYTEYTNGGTNIDVNSKCYMRLVTLYGWMILFGPFSLYLSIRVLRHLNASAKTGQQLQQNQNQRGAGRMNSKIDAINKAAKNIAIFTAVFGFIITVACIVRIRTSLTPNPNSEGRAGLVEFVTAVIPPVGILIFARPSMKFLDCKWKAKLDYYTNSSNGSVNSTAGSESQQQQQQQQQQQRKGSMNGGGSSSAAFISKFNSSYQTSDHVDVNSKGSGEGSSSTNQYVSGETTT
jgi:hypothetical protein